MNSYKILNLNINNLNHVYKIESNINYIICRNNTKFYNSIHFDFSNNIKIYLIDTPNDKEWCFFIHFNKEKNITLHDILKYNNFISENTIGYNLNNVDNDYIQKLYYVTGFLKINLEHLGIKNLYNHYVDFFLQKKNIHFNKKKFIRIISYYAGYNKNKDKLKEIDSFIEKKKNLIITQNCLVVCKIINGYGGNQLTSIQLINTLEHIYNVFVLSIAISETKTYSYKNNKINNIIHNSNIIKLRNKKDIINHINTSNYALIINNKMNEFFSILPEINFKIDVITHNTMDPYNQLIINNQHQINRIFTINKIHQTLFENYGIKDGVKQYINYVNSNDKIKTKEAFSKKIIFVGRLSKEKNLTLLCESFKQICNILNLTLYIIGDSSDNKYKINHPSIIYTGYKTKNEILNILKDSDYLLVPSYTEGLPFCILEAMSIGIPCICSNTNGLNEIINQNRGFLFELEGYSEHKYTINDWEVYNTVDSYFNKNVHNLMNIMLKAYNISLDYWNNLSNNCYNYIQENYIQDIAIKKNLNNLIHINNTFKNNLKHVFINFKDNPNMSYGGGNISTYYIQKYLKLHNFTIHYELNKSIQIYLIIDPFKNEKAFKKYGLSDIINYKNKYTPNSKIVIRINDCDKTRPNIDSSLSREKYIHKFHKQIDFYIFNSEFIYNYYTKILNNIIDYKIIYNGCDLSLYKPKYITKTPNIFTIVTHHWSPNIFKGYEIYLELYNYCNVDEDFKFKFIGNKVHECFKDVPICGPFYGKDLVNNLNNCHIYITDSKYDSCPNHVLEAISCGLPILFTSCEGGGKNLCNFFKNENKIGESYDNFEELIDKLNLIKKNYSFYRNNVLKYRSHYNYISSCNKYVQTFNQILDNMYKLETHDIYSNNTQTIIIKNPTNVLLYKKIQKNNYDFLNYSNAIIISKNITKISTISKCSFNSFGENKINNDNINILYSCDDNYFVGMFASLHSVLSNSTNYDKLIFNFIIPFYSFKKFNSLMDTFIKLTQYNINKNIILIDNDVIPSTITESKCYKSGNHLLNIGNFSRLLIGEIFSYKKLIYLDSDSIIQTDLYTKLKIIDNETCPYLGLKANVIGKTRQQNICLKIGTIIKTEYNWENVIGTKINKDDWAYMGAPFIANCSLWINVYKDILNIVELHNKSEDGLYNIFTMSLQNIIFYKKNKDISPHIKCLCDCGSLRKKWTEEDLQCDILDWSGIYKPWFDNGLHRHKWLKHDILNLSDNKGNIQKNTNEIETFR